MFVKIKTIVAAALPFLVLTGCAVRGGGGEAVTWSVTVPTVSFNVPTIAIAVPEVAVAAPAVAVAAPEVVVEPAVTVAAPEVVVEPAVAVAAPAVVAEPAVTVAAPVVEEVAPIGGVVVDVEPAIELREYIYDPGFPPGCYFSGGFYFYGGERFDSATFHSYAERNVSQRRFAHPDENRRAAAQHQQMHRSSPTGSSRTAAISHRATAARTAAASHGTARAHPAAGHTTVAGRTAAHKNSDGGKPIHKEGK